VSLIFPRTISTPRLVLRPWEVADAVRMKAAIDANLEHLQAWMPWAMAEPSPIEEITARIEKFEGEFERDEGWIYGVFAADGTTVLGSSGIHRRDVPDGLEIGYWIDAGHTRQGYATEAAAALTRVAFTAEWVQRMWIRCDPNNVSSAAVAQRVGYRHVATLVGDSVTTSGAARDTMVWEMASNEFEAQMRRKG
jgi:RimJ/RimL family protein N-acetyltransferase